MSMTRPMPNGTASVTVLDMNSNTMAPASLHFSSLASNKSRLNSGNCDAFAVFFTPLPTAFAATSLPPFVLYNLNICLFPIRTTQNVLPPCCAMRLNDERRAAFDKPDRVLAHLEHMVLLSALAIWFENKPPAFAKFVHNEVSVAPFSDNVSVCGKRCSCRDTARNVAYAIAGQWVSPIDC